MACSICGELINVMEGPENYTYLNHSLVHVACLKKVGLDLESVKKEAVNCEL